MLSGCGLEKKEAVENNKNSKIILILDKKGIKTKKIQIKD